AELREAGLTVHTLAEVYGEQAAQETEDTAWIALAAPRGWVVLTKDDRIRRRPAERQAIEDGKVRVFCLTNAGLTFAEQASYFVVNRSRIIQASRTPGPGSCALRENILAARPAGDAGPFLAALRADRREAALPPGPGIRFFLPNGLL